MSHSSKQITLVPVSDLLNMRFLIPSYQRGYRWTPLEVNDLLNDIYEFIRENEKSDKTAFYCLQPLVVYEDGDTYYLIDGQQRLTTIYLILTYLKDISAILGKGRYELKYETRPDSEVYLKEVDESKSEDNIDYFHISKAYDAIKLWFADKDGILKMKILSTITAPDQEGKNVKFIWYEIDKRDAIDVFTRINIGKIPLTNAELVKALFLRERNFNQNSALKQIFLASEWDDIEKKLSSTSFWYFLTNHDIDNIFDNKIELLLDLIAEKKPDQEKLHTFHYFNALIEKQRAEAKLTGIPFDIDILWRQIKDKFQLLEEWFNNHENYHLIGFLIQLDVSILDILKMAAGKKKADFVMGIRKEIKKRIGGINLNELSFDRSSDKRMIRKVLLLFNIESILQSRKSYLRFPFDKYKRESWDIEHINPQTPFDNIAYYRQWCQDILEYMLGVEISLEDLMKQSSKFEDYKETLLAEREDDTVKIVNCIINILNSEDYRPMVEELAADLFSKFTGADMEDTNHISNLTLLDPVTNRGYGNALFPVKRNKIIENDRNGVFIPICTRNVFLKYYSRSFSEVMYWKKSDAKAYYGWIEDTLKFYFDN